MTTRAGYIRNSAPWLGRVAIGLVAGGLFGVFVRDRVLEGGIAEYEAYGLLADVAQLEYDNAPPTRAIEAVNANIVALEQCRKRPKHKYPCKGIPLIRGYAMLAALHNRAGDSAAGAEATTTALQECTRQRQRACGVDDLTRWVPAVRENGVHP